MVAIHYRGIETPTRMYMSQKKIYMKETNPEILAGSPCAVLMICVYSIVCTLCVKTQPESYCFQLLAEDIAGCFL